MPKTIGAPHVKSPTKQNPRLSKHEHMQFERRGNQASKSMQQANYQA